MTKLTYSFEKSSPPNGGLVFPEVVFCFHGSLLVEGEEENGSLPTKGSEPELIALFTGGTQGSELEGPEGPPSVSYEGGSSEEPPPVQGSPRPERIRRLNALHWNKQT